LKARFHKKKQPEDWSVPPKEVPVAQNVKMAGGNEWRWKGKTPHGRGP